MLLKETNQQQQQRIIFRCFYPFKATWDVCGTSPRQVRSCSHLRTFSVSLFLLVRGICCFSSFPFMTFCLSFIRSLYDDTSKVPFGKECSFWKCSPVSDQPSDAVRRTAVRNTPVQRPSAARVNRSNASLYGSGPGISSALPSDGIM